MKNGHYFISFALIFILAISAQPVSGKRNLEEVQRLQWMDPLNRSPLTYNEYRLNSAPFESIRCEKLYSTREEGPVFKSRCREIRDYPLVLILVNERLSTLLTSELTSYAADLEAEGYDVETQSLGGGTAEDVKALLQTWLPEGLAGAVFVGKTPLAWYHFDGEEFPIDLYFMDLNGNWSDNNSDGLYDSHSGAVSPEIWVGRINAHHISWDYEISLTRNYFDKAHTYRTEGLGVPQRALAFNDDDWPYSNVGLNYAYSDVTVINQDGQTTAANYRDRLITGYEWVHIMAHSCPWAHTFKDGYYDYAGCYMNYDLDIMDPNALFYQLFACSNTRFVEIDNIAVMYVFRPDRGLAAVGSAKVGSMLDFEEFYYPLGQAKCLGQAFLEWFQYEASDGFDYYDEMWFYGMNIIGDPTLKVNITDRSIYKESRSAVPHAVKKEVDQNVPDADSPACETLIETKVSTSGYSDAAPYLIGGAGEELWLTWLSALDGRCSACASRYDGSGWETPDDISGYEYWEENPMILRTGDGVRAFFAGFNYATYDQELKTAERTGSYWGSTQFILNDPGYDIKPAACLSDGIIHLFWENWRDAEANIYLSTKPESGGNWSAPGRLTEIGPDDQDPLCIVDDADNVHLIWSRSNAGRWEVVCRYELDGFWTPVTVLSDEQEDAFDPSATVTDNGEIWIAYVSGTSQGLTVKTVHGNLSSWSSPSIVDPDYTASPMEPSIAASSNAVHLAYRKTDAFDSRNIWFTSNSGAGWQEPIQTVQSSGHDWAPSLAVNDADQIFVAWISSRDGDADTNIYAKRIVTAFPTPYPTVSPTMEPTVVPTWTQTTTPTQSPTKTPTCSETPTKTPSRTPTPTSTASMTPSPSCTPETPTFKPTEQPTITQTVKPSVSPSCTPNPPMGITLHINADYFCPNDPFELYAVLYNPGPDTLENVPFAVLLDVHGIFFYYPDWLESFDYEPVDFNPGSRSIDILNFIWPDTGEDSMQGIKFHAALLNYAMTDIIGNYDSAVFSYGP